MHPNKLLFIILVLASSLQVVTSFSNGKVLSACESMTPGHEPFTPQNTAPPYKIVTIDSLDEIQVILRANSAPFRGFLLEAENNLGQRPVGTFTLIDSSQSQLLSCSGNTASAVSHTTNLAKTEISVKWKKPKEGNYTFRATFVRNYADFWVDELSTPISTTFPTTSTTTVASTTTANAVTTKPPATTLTISVSNTWPASTMTTRTVTSEPPATTLTTSVSNTRPASTMTTRTVTSELPATTLTISVSNTWPASTMTTRTVTSEPPATTLTTSVSNTRPASTMTTRTVTSEPPATTLTISVSNTRPASTMTTRTVKSEPPATSSTTAIGTEMPEPTPFETTWSTAAELVGYATLLPYGCLAKMPYYSNSGHSFQVHVILMSLFAIVNIIASILVFVEGWRTEPHPILVCAVTVLTFVQIIVTFFRCGQSHELRFIFGWFHKLNALAIVCLTVAAVFTGLASIEATSPQHMLQLMGGSVAWDLLFFIVHLLIYWQRKRDQDDCSEKMKNVHAVLQITMLVIFSMGNAAFLVVLLERIFTS